MWGPLIVAIALVVIIIFMFVGIYNRLVNLREMIRNAWSQIDVQLKRRHDLIPNLIETVKGYSNFESSTLEKVIQARNMAMSATTIEDKQQAENTLSGTLKSLFALSESYPDLKANASYMQLQEELTATESKIAFARQYYNDTVNVFNASIKTFPTVMFAASWGFSEQKYFEVVDADREVPQVKF
ncbi:MAG: LemA family protein [bacterium]